MINSWFDFVSGVFFELSAAKTLLCTVFTIQLGPKLLKQFFGIVYFELGWGRPRLVLPAAL